jgi:hypothetical protein
MTRIIGILHEDLCTFMIVYRSFLLIMRNVWDKIVEKIKTHILCSVTFNENRTVCEIMWKNVVQPFRPQITVLRMRIACWVPKATNTLSEYVILIVFSPQQCLHEHFPLLLCTYIASFVMYYLKVRCSKYAFYSHYIIFLVTSGYIPIVLRSNEMLNYSCYCEINI